MNPSFSPPLHKQRHQFVLDFVNKNKPKKVVDFGCGECILLKKLKFYREIIDLLVGVDINGTKLRKHVHSLAPISTDYLEPSFDQMRVELYQGSVTQKDARLRGFDLVVGIELIEHLSLADVEPFSEVLFGYMAPVAVIISTPNSEYNPLFPGLTGFRNSDHKFEWTRAEFRSWALKVCLDYGYEVELTGVGQAPPGLQESVGFCTQIGVFHSLSGRHGFNLMPCDDGEGLFSYTPLYSVNYPSLHDNNTLRRVLVSEVLYSAEKLKQKWMEGRFGNRNEALPLCHAEGGEWGACITVQNTGTQESSAACEEELEHPTEPRQSGGTENREGECEESSCNNRTKEDSFAPHWRVSVPLSMLWSFSPKLHTLGGSLANLRHLLTDDPLINLNQDRSAVLLRLPDQDQENDGDEYDPDDSGFAEDGIEQEQNFEPDI